MINIKINGKKEKFPTCYEDLSFSDYEVIVNAKSFIDVVSAMLGRPSGSINLDLYGSVILNRALSFLKTEPVEIAPDIKSLDDLPIGAYKDIQSVLENKETATERVKWMVAIYEQWKASGNHDFGKVPDFVARVEGQPCLEVLGKAGFFLSKFSALSGGTVKTVSMWSLLRRKSWQVLTKWKGSVSLIYYLLYAKILARIVKRYYRNTR